MEQQTKIALITGGSRGLGRNAALALANKGIDVIITYHSQQAQAESLVQEMMAMGRQAAAIQLDAGNTSTFNHFGDELLGVLKANWQRENIDFLINNAGFGLYASIADTTEAQFDELMNVHVKGVFFLTQKLMPHLADNGAIINVSSGLTRFTIAGSAAYAAMKGAVEVLTRYMAKELGARGIRVNTLAPGAIATDFGGGRLRASEEMQAFIGSQTALGRTGEADDIGGIIATLCASEMGWVNAQRIEASGGMFL
ncbi:NAD(P)-dependent dehydrogenase (short-subunit alcohol dehydrogenase family) [Paenibacillus phyllosphaerae]|uniref:NAD(P)-dependent dehydrogenase (Short-subunit alcohol dehydrogenase family) n=1 Tax=Paenibacillus phyllosphaerae TaxID=274593 RepID=A0A7W5B3X5_9BACL|nr:SDR family oxidoreductase [Paenibacillus phyllosphaerae]MBB3113932.1 NAD(P)-dependent dehydrogenase (short-subunit alcohol dehydrogenase family) [Paenibacillus phyllosphaerae]